eukprot:m.18391 g.18391  ORF g.18391 m.18391 type:complete len:544 (-) comp6300_c0_seq2:155-1786(-)
MGSPNEEPLRFKCCYLDEKRMVFCPQPVVYETLRDQIRELFQIEPFIYFDLDENRTKSISSQRELDEVLDSEQRDNLDRSKRFSVKLEIRDEHAMRDGAARAAPIPIMNGSMRQSRRQMPVSPPSQGRPSSPPPGQEFRKGGHRRTNSGSFVGGGIFMPERAGPKGAGNFSTVNGSIRSISSRSSNQSSQSTGSMKWTRSKTDEDRESGYGEASNYQRARSGTFPRQHSADLMEESHASTFPRRIQTENAAGVPIRPRSEDFETPMERRKGMEARAPTRWTRGKLLGSGAFGQVYLALDNSTGEEFAVKQVEIQGELGAENIKEVQSLEQEITLLKNLRHERIVTYYGTERTSTYLAIFMEYIPGRSIHTRLREYGAFREEVVRKYTRQVLEGIHYLHSHGIIHRDIKGANVLADANGNVKLADFGASKRLQSIKTMMGFKSIHGTPYWMSPEAITTGVNVGRETDIWSTGALVVEMLTTKPPFADCEPMAALFKIGQADTDFSKIIPQNASPSCRAFLVLCFKRDPKDRPTAKILLNNAFVR